MKGENLLEFGACYVQRTVCVPLTQNMSKSALLKCTSNAFLNFFISDIICCSFMLSSRELSIGRGWLFFFRIQDSLKKVWSPLTVALLLSETPAGRAGGQTTNKHKVSSVNDGQKPCSSRNTQAAQYQYSFVLGRQHVHF